MEKRIVGRAILKASILLLFSASCEQASVTAQDASGASSTASGTGEPTPGATPSIPSPPIVHLEPIDLATAVGATPLQLSVSNSARPVGIDALNELGKVVQLVTWPERVESELAVTKTVDTAVGDGQDIYSHIYFAPAAPLSDRWYALVVGALPIGFDWAPFSRAIVLKDGSHASRFRTGSDPRLTEISAYTKGGTQYLQAFFSEPLAGDPALVSAGSAEGAICQPQPLNELTLPGQGTGSAGGPIDTTFEELTLSCANALDFEHTITFVIARGLRPASGPALSEVAPAQLSVEPNDWVDDGSSGRLYRSQPTDL